MLTLNPRSVSALSMVLFASGTCSAAVTYTAQSRTMSAATEGGGPPPGGQGFPRTYSHSASYSAPDFGAPATTHIHSFPPEATLGQVVADVYQTSSLGAATITASGSVVHDGFSPSSSVPGGAGTSSSNFSVTFTIDAGRDYRLVGSVAQSDLVSGSFGPLVTATQQARVRLTGPGGELALAQVVQPSHTYFSAGSVSTSMPFDQTLSLAPGSYTLTAVASSVLNISRNSGTSQASFTLTLAPVCAADFDGDGELTPDDLADYIAAFFTVPADPRSDFNGDGGVDPDDLADYIGAYFAGC